MYLGPLAYARGSETGTGDNASFGPDQGDVLAGSPGGEAEGHDEIVGLARAIGLRAGY